jgi:hypothetical protein
MGTFSRKDLATNPAWAKALGDAPRGKRRPTGGPAMNATEAAYARHLMVRRAAGEVVWWAFNAVRLRIALGFRAAWFKPDFLVEVPGGRFEFHETKGHEREAAMLRLKVAAGMFPIPFVLVKRDGAGGWTYEDFGKRSAPDAGAVD